MTAHDPGPVPRQKTFLGHPVGLAWLTVCEFWERFSFYGMQNLLALYLTGVLLLPGHVERIIGVGPMRAALEAIYGAHTPVSMTAGIIGLYTGFVYLTPIIGGWVADRFIGRTAAVTLGALAMAAGHFLMAFEASFLLAIGCMLAGVGFFKGNIASQLGDLYDKDDTRRDDAYQVFLLAVQLAVVVSPLVTGSLGEKVGFHWGFGAAGVGMLVGLAVYLAARPALPPEPAKTAVARAARAPMTPLERRNVVILACMIPLLSLAMVGNQQFFVGYVLWAKRDMDLTILGFEMPVTWLFAIAAVLSSAAIVVSVAFWRWWGRRWTEPDELPKIAVGVLIAACGPLVLALASTVVERTGHKVGLGWSLVYEAVNDLGFANIFPIGLALYSRIAPKGLTGVMVGLYFLHLFAANLFVGWLGGLLEKLSGTAFWELHAAIVAGAGAALLVVYFLWGRTLSRHHVPAPGTRGELGEAAA
jgi:POT family proton-dependent oligopeptide transporter